VPPLVCVPPLVALQGSIDHAVEGEA
jgi:hypothetical protein